MCPIPHLLLSLKSILVNLFPNNSTKTAIVINTDVFHLIRFNNKFLVLLSLLYYAILPCWLPASLWHNFLHWLSRHCSLFLCLFLFYICHCFWRSQAHLWFFTALFEMFALGESCYFDRVLYILGLMTI